MGNRSTITERLEAAIAELQAIKNEIAGASFGELPSVEPEWVSDKLANKTCLQCGKKIQGRAVRGCHEACAKRVTIKIRAGEISETEAVRAGQIAATRITGRPPKTTAIDEYLASKSENPEDVAQRLQEMGRDLTRKKRAKGKKHGAPKAGPSKKSG